MKDILVGLIWVCFTFGGGLLCLLKPEFVWHMSHWLDVKGGEPSDFYLTRTRMVGGAILFLGVIGVWDLFFG